MPQKFLAQTLISATVLMALTLSGCALYQDSAPSSTSSGDASGSDGDLHGLNDDPELADDSITVLGKYAVDGDELDDEAPAEYAAVWERFAKLIPAEMRPEITLFVAIDAEKSGGTDGALQVNGLRPEERYIALDATGSAEPGELDRTMLHEYAHLLTLRDGQVDPDEYLAADCPVYADPKCPLETSYSYAYLSEFWPDTHGPGFDSSEDATAERYDEDSFVTDYAAKNPDEDIAEVFAEWVLENDSPTGDREVDEKLRFFDAYPELVDFRETVLAVL